MKLEIFFLKIAVSI